MMRTNNPALNDKVFSGWTQTKGMELGPASASVARPANVMTLQGTVNATMILLSLTAAAAVGSWWLIQNHPEYVTGTLIASAILSFITALLVIFKPVTAPYAAPVYALTKGVCVGAASLMYAKYAEGTKLGGATGTGIILQAGLLTFGIAFALLLAYTSRIIKATENFKLGVVAATGGILIFHLIIFVLQMCGVRVPWLWDGGIVSIGIAGFIVVIASLNLVLDFDFIEEGAKSGAPKYMEWYGAFGLLVTLIWLYMSLLRLLSLLNSRE